MQFKMLELIFKVQTSPSHYNPQFLISAGESFEGIPVIKGPFLWYTREGFLLQCSQVLQHILSKVAFGPALSVVRKSIKTYFLTLKFKTTWVAIWCLNFNLAEHRNHNPSIWQERDLFQVLDFTMCNWHEMPQMGLQAESKGRFSCQVLLQLEWKNARLEKNNV